MASSEEDKRDTINGGEAPGRGKPTKIQASGEKQSCADRKRFNSYLLKSDCREEPRRKGGARVSANQATEKLGETPSPARKRGLSQRAHGFSKTSSFRREQKKREGFREERQKAVWRVSSSAKGNDRRRTSRGHFGTSTTWIAAGGRLKERLCTFVKGSREGEKNPTSLSSGQKVDEDSLARGMWESGEPSKRTCEPKGTSKSPGSLGSKFFSSTRDGALEERGNWRKGSKGFGES